MEGRKWEDDSHMGGQVAPTSTTYKICSPLKDIDDFPMVSSLIDENIRWWRSDRVKALFYPDEAETILNIPLSYNMSDDSIIWVVKKKGVFTVKSAYYVALPLVKESGLGECSTGDYRAPLWRKMWHLKLPTKMRIFAWRACVNGLPTHLNMERRGIEVDAKCPLCEKAIESTEHALLYYGKICDVWWNWQSCPINMLVGTHDIVDVALQILESSTSHDLETLFVMLGRSGTTKTKWFMSLKASHHPKFGVLHDIFKVTIKWRKLLISLGNTTS